MSISKMRRRRSEEYLIRDNGVYYAGIEERHHLQGISFVVRSLIMKDISGQLLTSVIL